MVALPPGARAFQLRVPATRPEFVQGPSGEPFLIDAPFEKVRRIFPHEKRIARDTLVVWQSNEGVAGLGEVLTVDSLSGQTGRRIKRFEFNGDGKDPRCDVSPDGKHFVAATAVGSITVWSLADDSRPVEGFNPYSDKPDLKKAGLAAVYFTSEPGHLVTISTAGAVHLFEIAGRRQVGEFVPPHGVPGRVIQDKNVAPDEARSSVVIAVGGAIYQVSLTAPLSVATKLELPGEAERSLGIAAVGVPGRIAYAFEAGDGKKERGVAFAMPGERLIHFRWPDGAGEPTGIHWAGTGMAVIGTARGAVWVEAADGTFQPLALAEVAGGRSLHHATESIHWYLMPSPADKSQSLLLALGLPPQGFLDFRNAAISRQPLFTVRLDEKGLSK